MKNWFNHLKTAVSDAHEEARSASLQADFAPTVDAIDSLPEDLRRRVFAVFMELREKSLSSIPNWSREGALHVARRFFDEARRRQNFDRAGSLGHALAGMWLEAGMRETQAALQVHVALENFAHRLLSEDEIQVAPSVPECCPNPNAFDGDYFPGRLSFAFGFSEHHPVPVCWRETSESYLARLRWRGVPCEIERIDDLDERNFTRFPIQRFHLRLGPQSPTQRWTVHVSPFQVRTSVMAPEGFTLVTAR